MPADSSLALTPLYHGQTFRVRQQKEWTEILTGWETKNRYQIVGESGQPFLLAGEVGSGFMAVISRLFLKGKRPFQIDIRTPEGAPVLTLVRPWRWILNRLEIRDATGRAVGAIQQRWRWFTRAYEVENQSGAVVGQLEGPFFKPWTFNVLSNGKEVGKIQKKWSGFGKELFTDADNFGVELSPLMTDPTFRQLVLAATFLIDFVHFEKSKN